MLHIGRFRGGFFFSFLGCKKWNEERTKYLDRLFAKKIAQPNNICVPSQKKKKHES